MSRKPEILVIFNPISGDIDKKPILDDITLEAEIRGFNLKKYKTTGNDDLNKIKKILDDTSFKHVIAVGGDGTLQLVANAIKETNLPLGIIPAGSSNGLASNLNLPSQLSDQIVVTFGNHSIEVDMLSVNGDLCLHIADIGINAELIKNYENSKIRGKLGYALQTIPSLVKSDYPYKFEITLDNKDFTKEGIMLAIANAKQFGTGAMINPDGKLDDGQFEILVFKKMDVMQILQTLKDTPSMDKDFVECFSAQKAKIKIPNPIDFQIDGEYLGKVSDLEVKILPNKLKVLVNR
ncbi:diacylglycerol/lipid kinase family protein [Winogradskyella forsetii]|uniref:diacylglycerol/lipid kinase family protein n=1 Tax=Winogradskyella forsetii TaxID=2686077 RepID=UPI0015BA54D0|nr:diacylglycerol kinase family protein [Winogradskyella forsetii]